MKISKKFAVSDVVRSDTATRLGYTEQFTPGPEVIGNAKLLCENILDKIPYSFFISSFYRCKRLNESVGGKSTSDHQLGCAADIDSQNNLSNKHIFEWIKNNCQFDQLIYEHGNDTNPDWVHVSYRAKGNRNQVLKAVKQGGKTVYLKY